MGAWDKRILLASGIVGPPLFVAVFLREGAARADYDPRRFPVSSLALGGRGWVQSANFLLIGAAVGALARGMPPAPGLAAGGPAWERRLLALAGIGFVGAGVFATDPVFGYPPEAPLALEQFTARGHLHNLFSLLVFAGIPGAGLVVARHFARAGRPWSAAYALLTALGMLATFVIAGVGFSQEPHLVRSAGLWQRLSIVIGLAWVASRAAQSLRAPNRGAAID